MQIKQLDESVCCACFSFSMCCNKSFSVLYVYDFCLNVATISYCSIFVSVTVCFVSVRLMLQRCCKAVVVQRHSTDLCEWVGTSFLFGCFFGVCLFVVLGSFI